MSGVLSTGGIPIDEFSKSTPPGFKPGLEKYTFKQYVEKARLWLRLTDLPEHQWGPALAGRLKDKAYRLAIRIKLP